ncbi:hypothetical protein [Martelella alba]|uniref:Uncharacterized protein n=1 Tax=Martelella alba TaxID=2590451 RepID=A0ABY2SFA8_9HYPH|nr:hypothetical protein [Martelella alba]TKI03578.1 hypothetical protein FCN80_21100 [Martelella alba]
MSQSGYTLGRDFAIDLNTSYGVIRIPKITSFDAKPNIKRLNITLLTGQTDELLIPDNWNGTIVAARQGPVLDNFWAQWEADYYAGNAQSTGTITETINEPDGSTTVWRYQSVQFHLSDPGTKTGDKEVSQTLTWTAPRRIKVA